MFPLELENMKINLNSIKEQLQTLMPGLGVELVYLFGSKAENFDMAFSDTDIAVLVSPKKMPKNKNFLYANIYNIFSNLLPGQKLDIVFLNTAGLELKKDVADNGRLLFESVPGASEDFVDNVTTQYADFKPHLEMFNKQILNRLTAYAKQP